MSALSVNDPGDPRSHRYYAPRQRRVVAREATLQPVLERLRGSTRDYSADEWLGSGDPAASPHTEFVVVPPRRLPFAALAAFAGGATAVAALALAYVAFDANGGAPAAAAQPSAPAVAAAHAPAKIAARLTPNQPVARVAQPAQIATADDAAALPIDTAKGDRLDAAAAPRVGAPYDPLRSPVSLWGLPPTQAAIEGTNPALAASAAPLPPEAAAASPHQQAAQEQDAEHHAKPVRHRMRARHHVRHVRHHKPATTGQAASGGGGRTEATGAAQPTATKKFLGIFGG